MIPSEIHAIQVTNCNCDYGCPCQFNALPTYGTCEAAEGIKINKGFYGDVSLDGLTVVIIAKWSGPIHEGNGARQIIIDEQANAEQREGHEKNLTGQDTEEMATIFWVINEITSTRHQTLFKWVLVEADVDSRTGMVMVEDVFD